MKIEFKINDITINWDGDSYGVAVRRGAPSLLTVEEMDDLCRGLDILRMEQHGHSPENQRAIEIEMAAVAGEPMPGLRQLQELVEANLTADVIREVVKEELGDILDKIRDDITTDLATILDGRPLLDALAEKMDEAGLDTWDNQTTRPAEPASFHLAGNEHTDE